METININGGQSCVGIYLDGLSVYCTWISDRNESTKERRKYAADISVAATGFGMFVLWLLILAAYTKLIRFLSPKVDLIEMDADEKNPKIRRKVFDIILQYGFILTGIFIRWAYLCLVYLPNH